mmetsp:Transcript_89101/g.238636  ORF Transcript_89101/g.238636 Transcript_89101/m.238636 type:complete len:492 (+) Transcript_89101:1383-2858(+)
MLQESQASAQSRHADVSDSSAAGELQGEVRQIRQGAKAFADSRHSDVCGGMEVQGDTGQILQRPKIFAQRRHFLDPDFAINGQRAALPQSQPKRPGLGKRRVEPHQVVGLLGLVEQRDGLRAHLAQGKQRHRSHHTELAVRAVKSAEILVDTIDDHCQVLLVGRHRPLQVGPQGLVQPLRRELCLPLAMRRGRRHLAAVLVRAAQISGGGGGRQHVSAPAHGRRHRQGLAFAGDDHVLEPAPHARGHGGVRVNDEYGPTGGSRQRLVKRRRQRALLAQFLRDSRLAIGICAHPIQTLPPTLVHCIMCLQAGDKVQHRLPPPVRHKKMGLPLIVAEQLGEAAAERANKPIFLPFRYARRKAPDIAETALSAVLDLVRLAAGGLAIWSKLQRAVCHFVADRGCHRPHKIVNQVVQVDVLCFLHGLLRQRVDPAIGPRGVANELGKAGQISQADGAQLSADPGEIAIQQVLHIQGQNLHGLPQLLFDPCNIGLH